MARVGWAITVSLAVGLGASACGGESATADDASAAVEDFLKQLSAGDYDDACDRLTEDAQQQVVDEWNEFDDEGVDSCSGAFKAGMAFAELFSDEGDDPDEFDVVDVTAELDGETAVATVDYKDDDDETYDLTFTDGTWLISSLDDEEDDASSEEESEPEATSEPSAEPSAVGEPASLGDWTVTVSDIETNADKTLAAPDFYNEEPDQQYLLVTYQATYNGEARSASVDEDFTWTLAGNDNSVYESEYQTTPSDDESWPSEVRTGGTARDQVVFDVDPSVIEGGLLTVEMYGDDGETMYVDFQL
ncbi:DUF4352 domain-containing protein [Nocardioides sp. BGMRC 2183]|nr:DUF4352 domain-containing protein [Nocardioides sp. BGMRC 2183]